MKKSIIKTVVITVISFIFFVFVFFGGLCLFAPKIAGNVFEQIGAYDSAITLYESNYNKSGKTEDLGYLIYKSDYNVNAEYVSNKCDELFEKEDFETFLTNVDFIDRSLSAQIFYGKNATSKLLSEKPDSAIIVSKNYVNKYGYTSINPFIEMLSVKNVSKENLIKIKDALTELKGNLEGNELVLIGKDINALQLVIDNYE